MNAKLIGSALIVIGQGLQDLGRGIADAKETLSPEEATSAPVKPVKAAKAPAKIVEIPFEDVKALANTVMQKKGVDCVKDLLRALKAKKMSEVKSEDYPKFMADLNALNSAATEETEEDEISF